MMTWWSLWIVSRASTDFLFSHIISSMEGAPSTFTFYFSRCAHQLEMFYVLRQTSWKIRSVSWSLRLAVPQYCIIRLRLRHGNCKYVSEYFNWSVSVSVMVRRDHGIVIPKISMLSIKLLQSIILLEISDYWEVLQDFLPRCLKNK